jgi:hypothetical protein
MTEVLYVTREQFTIVCHTHDMIPWQDVNPDSDIRKR